MGKRLVTLLAIVVVVGLVSPVLAEYPKPELVRQEDILAQLKTPVRPGPVTPPLPEPPTLIRPHPASGLEPTGAPGSSAPTPVLEVEGIGTAEGGMLLPSRPGGGGVSARQKARHDLKKLIRQLG